MRTRESPAAGRRNRDTTGLMPPARHGAGHPEHRHLAPRALHPLHLHREVPQQPDGPGPLQPLGLSPQEVEKPKTGPAVSSYSCSVQSEQQQDRETGLGSRRNCKYKWRKNLTVPTSALLGRTPTPGAKDPEITTKVVCNKVNFNICKIIF